MILAALCEGMGAGEACEDWHNRNFRDLIVEEIQLDEQWGLPPRADDGGTEAQQPAYG